MFISTPLLVIAMGADSVRDRHLHNSLLAYRDIPTISKIKEKQAFGEEN